MAETLSLLEFIRLLFTDEGTRAEFSENPEATLAEHGLEDLSPADVQDALVLVEDNQTADFSRDYNTGGNDAGSFTVPPVPAHSNGGGDSHQDAIQYLNTFITNNFIDDRDTITDNSINQQVDTGGGDFDQDIDIDSVVASGDGAVAAGDDIEDSTIVTGDGNTVGDGNVQGDGNIVGDDNDGTLVGDGDGNVVGDDNQAVTGDGNTTSFGDGDATSLNVGDDLTVGNGSAFSVGGDAEIDNTDNSTTISDNDFSDNSVSDSGNDNSVNTVEDSFNTETDVDIDDSGNANRNNSDNDSGNDNSVDQDVTIDV
jgi:hypothetical protein